MISSKNKNRIMGAVGLGNPQLDLGEGVGFLPPPNI